MKIYFIRFISIIFIFFVGFGFCLNVESKEEIIFRDLHIMAAELVDDMVYSWLKNPPFSNQTQVTIVEITAPVSLDNRFNTVIENRLYELFQKNPQLKIELVHCSSCSQIVSYSNSEKTIISRGIDQPEVLNGILKLAPKTMALSLNFEVQEREIYLQSHIFELAPPQKILWAQKYSTSMGVRASLREATPLLSLESAREIQNKILIGREPLKFISRLQIHNFETDENYTLPPLLFGEQSLEGEILPERNQKFGLSVGVGSVRDSYSGWTVGGRYSKLMFRDSPSLIHPDMYWFLGVQYMRLQGPGAAVFAENQLDLNKLINSDDDPKASLTNYQFGFEALIKYKFGLSVYLEFIPALSKSKIIHEQSLIIPYHGIGTALVFQW